jgi:hypothetical protein
VIVLIALAVVSFGFGLIRRLPWWAALPWPLVCIVIGALDVQSEPPNYDMHGYGYLIGGFGAFLCVAAWGIARVSVRLEASRDQFAERR